MQLKKHNIKSLVLVLPKKAQSFEKQMLRLNIPQRKITLLKEEIGIKQSFKTDENTFASDLATKALNTILEKNKLDKKELHMLIICTQSPDYLAPALSSLVHKQCNLNSKTLCLDFTGFCTSFLQGIFQAFLALENPQIHNCIFICVSTKSKKFNTADKLGFASITDSASAVLITKNQKKEFCHFKQELFSAFALEETLPLSAYKEANDKLYINNTLFFDFIFTHFKDFLNDFFKAEKLLSKDFEAVFFHSPNAFFEKKLLQTLNINKEKYFNKALKDFANADANNIALNLHLFNNGGGACKMLLASFGTGIVLNALALELKEYSFYLSFYEVKK